MILPAIAAIVSGILLGITESINKNITETRFSAFAYSFLQTFLNFAFYLVPFLLFSKLPAWHMSYFLVFVNASILFFSNIFVIKAYKTEDISIVTILIRTSLVVAFLNGIFLLSESLSLIKIIGVGTILIGILIIFYENKKIKLTIGLILALSAGILWGFVTYFSKLILKTFDPLSYLVLVQLITASLLFLVPRTRRDLPNIVKIYKWKILLSRITAVSAIYLIVWSIQNGNISIVNTNFETFALLSSVLIGIFILKEKTQLIKKFVGMGFCILGIIFLNFF